MSVQRNLIAVLLSSIAFAASATITVSGTRDFGGASVGTSCAGDDEKQQPVILIKDGGTIKNVVIQAGGAADGVHCEGNCTLENVSWPDVCEDAATMKGGSGKTMSISGGSASGANDKIFQHNGVGSTMNVTNFTVNGANGKFYRSCGNCATQGKRTINVSQVTVNGSLSGGLVHINSNYGDMATIRAIRWKSWNDSANNDLNAACITSKGVTKGNGSSKRIGIQWNTTHCNVQKSDITSF